MMLIDPNEIDARSFLGCDSCGLWQHCTTQKMPLAGQGGKRILLLTETPSAGEDRTGTRGVGDGWAIVREVLEEEGIDVEQDCWLLSAVNCRTGRPQKNHIDSCREYVVRDAIRTLRPRTILAFGKIAFQSVVDDRLRVDDYERWVGRACADQEWGAWVFPIWPLDQVLRSGDPQMQEFFSRYIRAAVRCMDDLPEDPAKGAEIKKVRTRSDCVRLLRWLRNNVEFVAFDYETTGLDPHEEGAQILCAAVAWQEDGRLHSAAIDFADAVVRREFAHLLEDERVALCAHNAAFEDLWSRTVLGVVPVGWVWDTMVAAHVVHNRSHTGLKAQVYCAFGVAGYDRDVATLMTKSGKNRLHTAMDDVLRYCALDALYTLALYYRQVNVLGSMSRGNDLLQRGIFALVDATARGIPIDEEYYRSVSARLRVKIQRLRERVMQCPDVEQYIEQHRQVFNPTSAAHIAKLLTTVHGITNLPRTATGSPQVDDAVLEKYEDSIPSVRYVRQIRETTKIQSTYIEGVLNVSHNGRIHPQFHLNRVATFRSSSSRPNFQNFPKRNARIMQLIRTGIRPSPGHCLLAADYGGIEVRISACVHQDPNMIRYVTDPTTDMHRDQAMELFCLPAEQVTKSIRHAAKNQFVFPSFYGSYYAQTAVELWGSAQALSTADGTPVLDVLREHNIRNYRDFEEHVQRVEKRFWGERFAVFDQWKRETWEEYQRLGYVELKTGFRCYGPLRRNEVINYQIQGPAFHCLLWSLIRVSDELRARGARSAVVGQIHDEMVLDVHQDELDDVVQLVDRVMRRELPEYFDWIVVPLEIEIERSAVDGCWAEMEVVNVVES